MVGLYGDRRLQHDFVPRVVRQGGTVHALVGDLGAGLEIVAVGATALEHDQSVGGGVGVGDERNRLEPFAVIGREVFRREALHQEPFGLGGGSVVHRDNGVEPR